MTDDMIFKALADESRRILLDALFAEDGQTLTELQNRLLPMTRFGTMKHLHVLEEAKLISTRKVGREKHHYLNPVPIQLVYDRWVSKYAQPYAQSLTGLKYLLEANNMETKPTHVFEVFIRTSPEKLWQALTDGTITPLYYFGSAVESTWEKGATYRYPHPAGGDFLHGEVLEIDPPHRMVTTMIPSGLSDTTDVPTSTVTYEIAQEGNICKLTLTHEKMTYAEPLQGNLVSGWARILSSLKSLLETGEAL